MNIISEPVRFHLSLNVGDLKRSVAFYEKMFGTSATKCHDDYAKFDLIDPPTVFSLVPHATGAGASLSHMGLRVPSQESLERHSKRIQEAGLCMESQDGTTCGYAKQNKLWLRDPDGNFWEIYHIEEDVAPESVRKSLDGPTPAMAPVTESTSWEYYITDHVPEKIPHGNASLDEVRLTGAFNAALDDQRIATLLAEAMRVLKPSGKLVTHGLMSDRPIEGASPSLPGLAALVRSVPDIASVVDVLLSAGFVGLSITKLTEKAWFVHEGRELREVKIVAQKPTAENELRAILYKGPFAFASADGGMTMERGRKINVPASLWNQLRNSAAAEQFLFFESDASSTCSTT